MLPWCSMFRWPKEKSYMFSRWTRDGAQLLYKYFMLVSGHWADMFVSADCGLEDYEYPEGADVVPPPYPEETLLGYSELVKMEALRIWTQRPQKIQQPNDEEDA